MQKNSLEVDITASETGSKKEFGRKTGWCSSPSSYDGVSSHTRCDGIWCETKEGKTLLCPCKCHEVKARKLANAKKKKKKITEDIKPATQCETHPKYGGIRRPRSGCDVCMSIYESNKSNKELIVSD